MGQEQILTAKQSRRRVVGGAFAASMVGKGAIQAGADHRAGATQAEGHVQAVVSNHELATQAGLDILEAGGSAADAAIAVAAVLTVVEGYFSSVFGGGTWALYYDAESGEITSLDGVGPVGSMATVEDYAPRAGDLGIHQSIVPGAWDGWMLWLERYGRLDLGQILQPAIDHARNGHPASEELVYWMSFLDNEVFGFPDSTRNYAPNGVIPEVGDPVYLTELAGTFEAVVGAYDAALPQGRSAAIQAARDYYYRGPLAEAIVAFSNANGGYFTLQDFDTFEAQIVDAVSIDYGDGITVYQNPPNSQGVTMLLALNILKGMGLSDYSIDDVDAVHMQIEAMKLAMVDRHEHIGDPARVDIPLDELLSDEHAVQQRERIDMDDVLLWPIESGVARRDVPAHTTTFQIVDRDGSAASVTTSIGAQFQVVGTTGINMNNRMRFLSVEDGNPNELTPGYKVRHTSCPYLATRDGRPYILGGNTGADVQTQAQLQEFLSVVAFGLSAQEAVERPRWVSTAFPSSTTPWTVGNTLQMERGFTPTLLSLLQVKGHDIEIGAGIYGDAAMVVINDDGTAAEVGVEPRNSMSSGEVIEP